jgi:3-oxoacyl-[acyl-carrier protein] reductase
MYNRNRFEDKHVMITGAARGIGFEIAKQFYSEGAIISLLDINEDNLRLAAELLDKNSRRIYTYNTDISVQAEVENVISLAERIQPIDVLVNNAGIAEETPFLHISAKQWRNLLDVNLTGMFYVSQAVCKNMASRKEGVVVNMGSKNALDGEFGYAHYNASKAGVLMLTKTMALELAHLGIRVNAVCPGYIQTPMSAEIDSPEFTKDFVNRYIPLNRPGKVAEIAPIFLFLASDESSFITGQIIIADGGQLTGQKPGADLILKYGL